MNSVALYLLQLGVCTEGRSTDLKRLLISNRAPWPRRISPICIYIYVSAYVYMYLYAYMYICIDAYIYKHKCIYFTYLYVYV